MVELANASAAGADEEVTKPEAPAHLEQTCEAEEWPAEIRRCLLEASDQDAATACMRDLGETS